MGSAMGRSNPHVRPISARMDIHRPACRRPAGLTKETSGGRTSNSRDFWVWAGRKPFNMPKMMKKDPKQTENKKITTPVRFELTRENPNRCLKQ